MANEKRILGYHCAQILGPNGLPLLNCPPHWKGPVIERRVVPANSECGPQSTGMPVISIGLVGRGRRWYRSGGKTRELQSGPMRFDVHGATYERDYGRWEGEQGESITLRLNPSFIRHAMGDEADLFDLDTRYENTDRVLTSAVQTLAQEMQSGFPNGYLYAEGVSLMIMGWLNQHYAKQQKTPPASRQLSLAQKNRLRNFIEQNLGSQLTVESMALIVGISPNYFSALFRTSFGEPPHHYVMQRRIERAAYLLRHEPNQSITDIAFSVGFASQAHMTYAFKRHKGLTPARWRNAKCCDQRFSAG